MERCYNCRVELSEENRTREHIPAQNTFVGYPPEFKENRLTVPACNDCNNQYSKIDQQIRDAIGIMNENNNQQNELTKKSVKSIMRSKNWMDRVHFSNGKVVSVTFDYNVIKELHIKNFKGIFYKKYGFPVPPNFEIGLISEGDEEDERLMGIAQNLYDYVASGNSWSVSGHKNIFKYNIKSIVADAAGKITDGSDISNAIAVVGVMVYHETLCPVIMAAKKEYLEKIKKTPN